MLSIIIVSYRSFSHISKCLASLAKNDPYFTQFEIIIINNDPADTLLVTLLTAYSNVKLINNLKNVGFGGACNLGISVASHENLLILNPDTYVKDSSISVLLMAFLNQKKCDVIAPMLFYPDGGNQSFYQAKSFPTIFNLICHSFFLHKLPIRKFDLFYDRKLKWSTYTFVDTLCGAAFLTNKSFFSKVGLFDERFFLYFEETDLFFRAKQFKSQVAIFEESKVFHEEGLNQKNNYLERKKQYYRSLEIFYTKNFSKSSFVTACVILIIGEFARFVLKSILLNQTSWRNFYNLKALLPLCLMKIKN